MPKHNIPAATLRSPRTLQAEIAQTLTEAIVQGELLPAQHLRTDEIAQQFGVSRIPVREALHQLASEGFVTLSPQRGAFVANLSLDDLRETYFLRKLLEPAAARAAVLHLSEALLTELGSIVDDMERSEDDHAKWTKLDRLFHLRFYECAGMPKLLKLISQLRLNSERYRALYVSSTEYLQAARARHRALFETYLAGDSSLAEAMTLEHLNEIEMFLLGDLESRGII